MGEQRLRWRHLKTGEWADGDVPGPMWETLQSRASDELAKIRRARGLSQAEAAEASGVHWAVIARIEQGRSGLSLITAHRLARAYGVSLDAIVGDAEWAP